MPIPKSNYAALSLRHPLRDGMSPSFGESTTLSEVRVWTYDNGEIDLEIYSGIELLATVNVTEYGDVQAKGVYQGE